MKKGVSTEDVRTVALSVGATTLLFMSGFLVLFTPLPLLYVFLTRGRRLAVMTMVAACAVMVGLYALLLPWLIAKLSAGESLFFALPGLGLVDYLSIGKIRYFGGAYFMFFLVLAAALGVGAHKGWKVSRWIGVTVAFGMGFIAVAVLLAKIIGGVSLIGGTRGYIEAIIAEIVALNDAAGISGAQLQYLRQHGGEVAATLLSLTPSMIFVFVLLASVLNMLVGRRFIRMPRSVSRWRQTITFRLPDQVVWALIGSGALFFLNSYVLHSDALGMIAVNGLIATCSLYFFQGFAVAAFFLERIKFRLMKLLSYIAIIIFFQTVGVMFVGVGIADVWVHFRDRVRKAKVPSPDGRG